jgi:hypothetical protein
MRHFSQHLKPSVLMFQSMARGVKNIEKWAPNLIGPDPSQANLQIPKKA